MTSTEMNAIANKAGMPVTTDPRAMAARAMIEMLHAQKRGEDVAEKLKASGIALSKAVKRMGKP